jgi:uncharacterized protein (TIRG00374 family)
MELSEENKKSKGSRYISIGFFLLIILGLYFIIDNNLDEITKYKDVLLHLNYWLIAISFLITFTGTFFRAWRWYYMVLPIKKELSLLKIYNISINALAANFTVPGKMGIPVKALLLKQSENVEMSKSLPSIFGEIFVEHSSEFLIAFVSVLIGGHLSKVFHAVERLLENNILVNVGMLLGILVVLFIIGVLFRKKVKSAGLVEKFVESIKLTSKRMDYLGYSYLITIINLIISYYGFYLVVAALGHPELDLTFIIFAGTITNFVGLISPFPGGIGARELTIYGLYDFYYGLGGIAFLSIIIMRLITYFALFLSFLMERMLSGSSLRKNRERVNSVS